MIISGRTCIGFDPGPKWTGFAVIHRDGRQFVFERGGEVQSHCAAGILADLTGQLVAIETPSGYVHDHARSAMLLATANVAGQIAGAARAKGHDVVQVAAATVRRSLCGQSIVGAANDAAVKRALYMYVDGLPRRTNSHVRDAALVALFALLNDRLAEAS